MTRPLAGKSILVVEDEIIIGMMLVKEIAAVGGAAIGPVTSVADALKEIESRIVDVVILDAKLIDGSGAELAACLEERRIAYLVVSGYERANLPPALSKAPFIAKPIALPLLIEAIENLASAPGQNLPPGPPANPLATADPAK
jgi:DNA-binding NtrC family response regulator